MCNIYLSFLGLGNYNKTVYELNEKKSINTEFVQVAERGFEFYEYLKEVVQLLEKNNILV